MLRRLKMRPNLFADWPRQQELLFVPSISSTAIPFCISYLRVSEKLIHIAILIVLNIYITTINILNYLLFIIILLE